MISVRAIMRMNLDCTDERGKRGGNSRGLYRGGISWPQKYKSGTRWRKSTNKGKETRKYWTTSERKLTIVGDFGKERERGGSRWMEGSLGRISMKRVQEFGLKSSQGGWNLIPFAMHDARRVCRVRTAYQIFLREAHFINSHTWTVHWASLQPYVPVEWHNLIHICS